MALAARNNRSALPVIRCKLRPRLVLAKRSLSVTKWNTRCESENPQAIVSSFTEVKERQRIHVQLWNNPSVPSTHVRVYHKIMNVILNQLWLFLNSVIGWKTCKIIGDFSEAHWKVLGSIALRRRGGHARGRHATHSLWARWLYVLYPHHTVITTICCTRLLTAQLH